MISTICEQKLKQSIWIILVKFVSFFNHHTTHTHARHGRKKIAGQFVLPLDPTKKWQHFCFCQHQMGIHAHTEGFVHLKKADVFVQIALIQSLMRAMLTSLVCLQIKKKNPSDLFFYCRAKADLK